MIRSLWQTLKDWIYDAASEQFRTQEEIDTEVESDLADYGAVVDEGDIPEGFSQRKRGVFQSPNDLIDYVTRSGLPSEYIVIEKLPFYEDDNTYYKVWIEDSDA